MASPRGYKKPSCNFNQGPMAGYITGIIYPILFTGSKPHVLVEINHWHAIETPLAIFSPCTRIVYSPVSSSSRVAMSRPFATVEKQPDLHRGM